MLFSQHVCLHNLSAQHVLFRYYEIKRYIFQIQFENMEKQKYIYFPNPTWKIYFANPIWKIKKPKIYIFTLLKTFLKWKSESDVNPNTNTEPNLYSNWFTFWTRIQKRTWSNCLSGHESKIKPEPMSEYKK